MDSYRERRFDSNPLRGVPVQLLDSPLSVASVLAHVPLTGGAIVARHRIRPPDDTGDEVSRVETGVRRRFEDACDRLVADDQALPTWRRPPICACCNLLVGAADADPQCLRNHCTLWMRRFRHIRNANGVGSTGGDANGAHAESSTTSSF